jgi:hypothetical protein
MESSLVVAEPTPPVGTVSPPARRDPSSPQLSQDMPTSRNQTGKVPAMPQTGKGTGKTPALDEKSSPPESDGGGFFSRLRKKFTK